MATTFKTTKNVAFSTLAGNITDVATTLNVAAGEGGRFPASNFWISIEDEILLCSSRTGDTLTVTRAQQGTTGAAHVAGVAVELRWTEQSAIDIHTAVNDLQSTPQYLALKATTVLDAERAFTPGAGLTATDGGAGGVYDLDLAAHGTAYHQNAAPVAIVPSGAAGEGTSLSVARADHIHPATSSVPEGLGNANAEGSTTNRFVRSDHVHKRDVRVKEGANDYTRNALTVSGLTVADDGVNDEVDVTHDSSSSGHHVQSHDHSAAGDGQTLTPATLNIPAASAPAQTAEGQAVWDSDDDKLTVGDGVARKTMAREDLAVMDGDTAAGELAGTYPNPTVADTHSGSAHHGAVSLAAAADTVLSLTAQEVGLDTQAANTLFAGPVSGPAADPTFRALVAADHPVIASGDLHPEYQTPAEHTAVGDGSPHHAAVHGSAQHTGTIGVISLPIASLSISGTMPAIGNNVHDFLVDNFAGVVTVTELRATMKTAPGADTTFRVVGSTTGTIGSVTVLSGATEGSAVVSVAVVANENFTLDITAGNASGTNALVRAIAKASVVAA